VSNVEASSKRQLTLIDCLGIGINGIVGSGIFLLPAALWRAAGGRAPLAWLIVGGLCCLVALCFAEAAARTERSGGPYRYACDAFGNYVGFAVGWVTLVSTMLGYSAVARGFGDTAVKLLSPWAPVSGLMIGQNPASWAVGLAGVMVALLCLINIIGVRSSARTSDAISAVKLLSLFLFLGIGAFFVKFANLHTSPQPAPLPTGGFEPTGLLAAAFAGLFATTGFEYIPVPAGEAKNPRRTVPLAMVISVLGTTVIYVLVQIVASGVHPNLGHSDSALADAAGQFGGSRGRFLMGLAALISSFGFCTSSALVGPRYLEAFSEDRFLPAMFGRRSERFGTPVAAVMVLSILVFGLLASGLNFDRLAAVSNIAVVVQYMATCVAVLVLRRRSPAPAGAFVIPLGPLVPLLALVGCVVFIKGVGLTDLAVAAGLIFVGLFFGWMSRRFSVAKGT
jgi:amino acid transporter